MAETDPIPTLADARRLAALARLELDDEVLAARLGDLASILRFVGHLNELELDGVEPLTHPHGRTMRPDPDRPRDPLPTEALMRMAPDAEAPFLRVPKVLGDGGGA